MSAIITLNCWVLGDDTSRVFPVEIHRNDDVADLRDAIKEEKKPSFQDVHADSLVLWKVSIHADSLDAELARFKDPQHVDARKLKPLEVLRAVFSDHRPGHLHVVVFSPPASFDPRQIPTNLPDLPFPHTGITIPDEPKSSADTSPRTFPRTDLEALIPWTTFMDEIDEAIQTAMKLNNLSIGHRLGVGNALFQETPVSNEEALRGHAAIELHAAVAGVAKVLGVQGHFVLPMTGNGAIVGDPDFSWVQCKDQPHPKLVVEYKTDWIADLVDLFGFFLKQDRNLNERQSIEALEQLYGYMTFNHNKYGILTNWTRAWCLRRMESSDRKTLECAGPFELGSPTQSPSMLKVFVGVVLLAQKDWFYASPAYCPPPPNGPLTLTHGSQKAQQNPLTTAGSNDSPVVNGEYPCQDLDFRLCDFQLSSARRSGLGCVVPTNLHQESLGNPPLSVLCKVVDVIHTPESDIALLSEVRAYAALQKLQGQVIPKFYGYYNIWGILKLIALEPVGVAIPEDQRISSNLRQKMKSALGRLHSAGYLHGDIACRNFCERNGEVFLVDLERCRKAGSQAEKDAEQQRVDSLY